MRSAARACSMTSVTMSLSAKILSPAARATMRPSAGTSPPDGGHPSSISSQPAGGHSTFDERPATPHKPDLGPRGGVVTSSTNQAELVPSLAVSDRGEFQPQRRERRRAPEP